MLKKEITEIIEKSKDRGWVLEPDAQKIFSLCGFKTPKYDVAAEAEQAVRMAHAIGYPVVAKVVSPAIVHKSDVRGVVLGIQDDRTLTRTFDRFRGLEGFEGMLIAEMVKGIELIIGAKNDYQFGPMILLGMGGIGVEIYRDISLRMAPLKIGDTGNMINELTARCLLTGYRGSEAVHLGALQKMLIGFSKLVMDIRDVLESIDLNPVMCTPRSCVVADARIMLKR